MASVQRLASVSVATTGPTVVNIAGAQTAFTHASFFFSNAASASTTSTWTISLGWNGPQGNAVAGARQTIATSGTITATTGGITEIVIDSTFDNTVTDAGRKAIPRPTHFIFTRVTASNATTPLVGEIWAMFAGE